MVDAEQTERTWAERGTEKAVRRHKETRERVQREERQHSGRPKGWSKG